MHALSSYTAKFVSVLVSRYLHIDGRVTDVTVMEARGVANMAEYTVTGKRRVNGFLIPVMARDGLSRANLLPVTQWVPVLHAAKRASTETRKGSGFYASHTIRGLDRENIVIASTSLDDFEESLDWLKPEQRPFYDRDDMAAFWDTYPGASMIAIIFGERADSQETLRVAYWHRPQYTDNVMVPTAFGAVTAGESEPSSDIAYTVMLGGEMLMPDIGEQLEVPEGLPGSFAFQPPTHILAETISVPKPEDDLYYRVSGNAIVELPEAIHHPAPARLSRVPPRRMPSVKILPVERVV